MNRFPRFIAVLPILVCGPVASPQNVGGTVVSSVNLTADARTQSFIASTAYTPHDILTNRYTTDNLAPGYQLLIEGVATVQNLDSHNGVIDILVVNSSPLCGSPYGSPPFGPGRVVTITIPAHGIVSVPVSVVAWAAPGITSTAHLQYRHASPFLQVKENSSLDVIMLPAAGTPTASPSQGLPSRPDDCP